MRSILSSMAVAAFYHVLSTAATSVPESELHYGLNTLEKRSGFQDSYKIFNRKVHAHACIMSIVFIVLFPIGAIVHHLPLRGTRVTTRIHAPIQLLGLIMMIGAMALGIDISRNDLHYLGPHSTIQVHVVFGLVITSMIILIQPALGLLQHLHYRRTMKGAAAGLAKDGEANGVGTGGTQSGKSVFGHVHRWFGRIIILCGWINAGLGFQLYGINFLAKHVIVREFVIMGALGAIWWGLVGVDGWRRYGLKKEGLASLKFGWNGRPVLRGKSEVVRRERVGEKIVVK